MLTRSLTELKAGVPRLGKENYLEWKHWVISTAQSCLVQNLLNGTEELKREPHWRDFDLPGEPAKTWLFDDNVHQDNLMEFNGAYQIWLDQAKRARIAWAILVLSVDVEMIPEICQWPTPREAYLHVTNQVLREPKLSSGPSQGVESKPRTQGINDFEAEVLGANIAVLSKHNLEEWKHRFLALADKHNLKDLIVGNEQLIPPPIAEDYPPPVALDSPQFRNLTPAQKDSTATLKFRAMNQQYIQQCERCIKANILIQKAVSDKTAMEIRCFFPDPQKAYRYITGERRLVA